MPGEWRAEGGGGSFKSSIVYICVYQLAVFEFSAFAGALQCIQLYYLHQLCGVMTPLV